MLEALSANQDKYDLDTNTYISHEVVPTFVHELCAMTQYLIG